MYRRTLFLLFIGFCFCCSAQERDSIAQSTYTITKIRQKIQVTISYQMKGHGLSETALKTTKENTTSEFNEHKVKARSQVYSSSQVQDYLFRLVKAQGFKFRTGATSPAFSKLFPAEQKSRMRKRKLKSAFRKKKSADFFSTSTSINNSFENNTYNTTSTFNYIFNVKTQKNKTLSIPSIYLFNQGEIWKTKLITFPCHLGIQK